MKLTPDLCPFESVTYSLAQVSSLIYRFEKKQLPRAEWTHQAHLVVAIWYNAKKSETDCLDEVRKRITAHNESVGTPNSDTEGYHETITRFWLIIARMFLLKGKELPLVDQINGFITSEQGRSAYPLEFYTTEVLFSQQARRQWVEPDKKGFPK